MDCKAVALQKLVNACWIIVWSIHSPSTNGDLDRAAGRQKEQVDPSSSGVDEAVEAESVTRTPVKVSDLRFLQDVILDLLLLAAVLEHALQTRHTTHTASQTRTNF